MGESITQSGVQIGDWIDYYNAIQKAGYENTGVLNEEQSAILATYIYDPASVAETPIVASVVSDPSEVSIPDDTADKLSWAAGAVLPLADEFWLPGEKEDFAAGNYNSVVGNIDSEVKASLMVFPLVPAGIMAALAFALRFILSRFGLTVLAGVLTTILGFVIGGMEVWAERKAAYLGNRYLGTMVPSDLMRAARAWGRKRITYREV